MKLTIVRVLALSYLYAIVLCTHDVTQPYIIAIKMMPALSYLYAIVLCTHDVTQPYIIAIKMMSSCTLASGHF